MIRSPFVLGILAGSMLGLPVGPNGALCVYRSLRFGWFQGLVTALGSVMAMCLHAIVAAILLSDVVWMMSQYAGRDVINRASGGILVAIGVAFYAASRRRGTARGNASPNRAAFFNLLSAFSIGVVNPKNVFGFASLLMAYSLELGNGSLSGINAMYFGCGVFASTALLFSLLIYYSRRYGERFFERTVGRLKYWVSGIFVVTGILKIIASI